MRSLKILGGCLILLAILAAGAWFYLQYQMQRITVDSAEIESFFQQPASRPPFADTGREPCNIRNPQRSAWFGALHIHTSASFDARSFGVTNTAEEAYAFARGQEVEYRLLGDDDGAEVPRLVLPRPLDFAAVTDHAERLGEYRICLDPEQEGHDALVCRVFRGDLVLPLGELMQPLVRLASQAVFGNSRSARVCGDDGSNCREQARFLWEENQRAAERWYDRSSDCRFTTFPAYEYSLAVEGSNLHRNVIFSGASVPPRIAAAADLPEVEQLWQWLNRSCRNSDESCDVLTIPHNSNWSSGRMWFPYSYRSELDPAQQKAYAALRQAMEPLAEIMQVKGDSECRNGLGSVFGAADELCDFEKLRAPSEAVEDCGEEFGSGNMRLTGCLSRFSYVRYALSTGLAEKSKLGVNPFQLGIIAATDNHNATANAEMEKGYLGANGPDREAIHRLRGAVEVPGGIAKGSPVRYNPGGVAGIWAEENTRESLFAAMKRRETFGTSGPRIVPRFFAGWSLPEDLCQSAEMVAQAYAQGVPMGSVLPETQATQGSPIFIASASQDPLGTALQRLQIVKGWVDEAGQTRQAIYDIAGDANNGAAVNPATCQPQGRGFAQLCNSWQDPEFDPAVSAVYYLRVVENPSCRWSTRDCNALPQGDRPPSCTDPSLPKTIQERAWTSPIWYRG